MNLEKILKDKLKKGSICLLNASPLSGRKIFTQQFFYDSMLSGSTGVYITTNNFTKTITRDICGMGWNAEHCSDRYIFIDTYSAQSDPAVEDTENIRYISSATDLAKLSNTIISSMGELAKRCQAQRVIFDSVDALLMHLSSQSVYRFLYYLSAKIRALDATGLFVVDSNLHEERTIKMLYQLADALINIDSDKKILEFVFTDGSKKVMKYEITGKGFEIY